jgi:tetratricopeptide (TPR) repeat protein
MKTLIVSTFILLLTFASSAQPNCNVFKWEGDTVRYEACELYTQAIRFYQGSYASQVALDSVIKICPTFDEAWSTKSIPYLKRGDFLAWKLLIDKAVELNPGEHLGYRGWCRYQFLRDYAGAIRDLELLDSLKAGAIGYSANGDYHLNIAKALCYKALGQKKKAVQLIENQLATAGYSPGLYDYLHLAVLQLALEEPEKALATLEKQEAACPNLAENAWYRALAFRRTGDPERARQNLMLAKERYTSGHHRNDPYDHPMDCVFMADIERAMAEWGK